MRLYARYNGGEWEHISGDNTKALLESEYRLAYGPGWEFRWA